MLLCEKAPRKRAPLGCFCESSINHSDNWNRSESRIKILVVLVIKVIITVMVKLDDALLVMMMIMVICFSRIIMVVTVIAHIILPYPPLRQHGDDMCFFA